MLFFFFFNDTATTEIYTLSLHDALPIYTLHGLSSAVTYPRFAGTSVPRDFVEFPSQVNEMWARSEEHTSELQSRQYLVCRLLLEKQYEPTLIEYTTRIMNAQISETHNYQ